MSSKKKTSKKSSAPIEELATETTQEKSGFSFDSIDAVHADIQDDSSDPNLNAVNAVRAEKGEEARETVKKASGKNVDSDGTVFNPELHAVNADGEPSVTPKGKFRKRRGASKLSVTSASIAEAQAEQKQRDAARAAGQLCADMLIGSSVMLLGPEWQPLGSDGKPQQEIEFNEHANMRRAFGDYFEAKGISDFPPGIALSIALTSYAMPRLIAGEETKSKLGRFKDWIGSKYLAMKAKRKPKDATQSNRGNDGQRQDNASKETVRDEQATATRHART